MSLHYSIDVERRLVSTVGTGRSSYEECAEVLRRLAADPAFSPWFRELADLAGVDAGAVAANDVMALAAQRLYAADSRRAIVASEEVTFGLPRIFQTYRDCEGEPGIRVCRTRAEALAWLELTE